MNKKKLTINDLYTARKSINKPLLGSEEFLAELPFMETYLEKYAVFDRVFNTTYRTFEPYLNTQYLNNDEVLENWLLDCESLLLTNFTRYTHIFSLNKLDYNPIHNYDRQGSIVYKKKGKEINTTNYGEQRNSQELGETVTHNEYGTQNGSETNSVAPYDSENFSNDRKKEIVQNSHSDSIMYEGQTNNDVQGEHTDVNTLEFTDREDETIEKITGNIGVTTTQEMMRSEVDFWKSFNSYHEIFNDIIVALCTCGKDYDYDSECLY